MPSPPHSPLFVLGSCMLQRTRFGGDSIEIALKEHANEEEEEEDEEEEEKERRRRRQTTKKKDDRRNSEKQRALDSTSK